MTVVVHTGLNSSIDLCCIPTESTEGSNALILIAEEEVIRLSLIQRHPLYQ